MHDLCEEASAAQLESDVIALEAPNDLLCLGEGPWGEIHAREVGERKTQAELEGAKGSQVRAQRKLLRPRAAMAHDAPVGDVERDGRRPFHLAPAANAMAQLRPHAQRVESMHLDADARTRVGAILLESLQGFQPEVEDAAHLGAHAFLGREPGEQLDHVAGEGVARGISTQRKEGGDESSPIEQWHPPSLARVDLHFESIEQIERAGETTHTAPRVLRHRGHSATRRGQQVDDEIGFPELHGAKHESGHVDETRTRLATRFRTPGTGH